MLSLTEFGTGHVHEQNEINEMVREMYGILFEIPLGSDKDERTMIAEIRSVIIVQKRVSWLFRLVAWLSPIIVAMATAITVWWEKVKLVFGDGG